MIKNKEIAKIEQEMQRLQKELETLQLERSKHLASIAHKIGLTSYTEEMIIGAFLHIKDMLSETDNKHYKLKEEWLAAGNKFLRKRPKKVNSTSKTTSPEDQSIDNQIKEAANEV